MELKKTKNHIIMKRNILTLALTAAALLLGGKSASAQQPKTFANPLDVIIGNDVDSPSKYPNPVKFTFKKDNCSLLDGIQKGQRVQVHFVVDGRRWDGPKGTQYFVDLTALKIEVLNADGTSTEPVPAPAEPDMPVDAGDVDDMPF